MTIDLSLGYLHLAGKIEREGIKIASDVGDGKGCLDTHVEIGFDLRIDAVAIGVKVRRADGAAERFRRVTGPDVVIARGGVYAALTDHHLFGGARIEDDVEGAERFPSQYGREKPVGRAGAGQEIE